MSVDSWHGGSADVMKIPQTKKSAGPHLVQEPGPDFSFGLLTFRVPQISSIFLKYHMWWLLSGAQYFKMDGNIGRKLTVLLQPRL